MRTGKEIEAAWKLAKQIIRNTRSEEETSPFFQGKLPDDYPGEMAVIALMTALELQNQEICRKLDAIIEKLAGE